MFMKIYQSRKMTTSTCHSDHRSKVSSSLKWELISKRHVCVVPLGWCFSLCFSSGRLRDTVRGGRGGRGVPGWDSPGKTLPAAIVTGAPRKTAGRPESWEPWTLEPSARWCHWRTPTDPGGCFLRPSHLKRTHTYTNQINDMMFGCSQRQEETIHPWKSEIPPLLVFIPLESCKVSQILTVQVQSV